MGFEHHIDAQRNTFERALEELRSGRKQGHWMWFIFFRSFAGLAVRKWRTVSACGIWRMHAPTPPTRCWALVWPRHST
ncbi:DUF1810 family protein [Albidovulum inexpectatum]|uniref:DUF1810 family protein n=1 Tax=Albidovulum inexpectatum TaxID=196587 RepID=UPI002481FD23|nr:DUF1810 family protein [Albidovulum inexpectatum]